MNGLFFAATPRGEEASAIEALLETWINLESKDDIYETWPWYFGNKKFGIYNKFSGSYLFGLIDGDANGMVDTTPLRELIDEVILLNSFTKFERIFTIGVTDAEDGTEFTN